MKDSEEIKSRRYLRRLLGQVGLTTLLSTDEVSKYDDEFLPTSAIETMVALSLTWGIPSLLMVYPMADPTATYQNILVISCSDRQDKNSLRQAKPFIAETFDSHSEPIARAIPDFTAKLLQNSRREVSKMARLVKIVGEMLSIVIEDGRPREEINAIAEEIVMASLILDDARNETNSLLEKLSNTPKRVKFRDIHYMTGNDPVNLLATINKYVSEHNHLTLTDYDDVIVDSPRSLALLFTLLRNKKTESIIKNYIAYSVIGILAPFVGRDARRRSTALAEVLGSTAPRYYIDRWCDMQAQEFLPLSYGSVFVREMVDIDIKAHAQLVVDYVKVAFVEAMRENAWMDRSTQLRAMAKLSAMTAHVGFPDWFEDKMEQFVEAPDLRPGNLFIEAVLDIKQHKVTIALRDFRKLNVRDVNSWNFSPASLNAFYEHARNSITIPAAVLLFPFFTKGAPAAFNYGSLGSIVGHEISHGFDTIGSNFDEQGNFIGWWSGRTKKKFDERNFCFVKQYEELQNEILGGVHESGIQKQQSVNSKQSRGQRTLPENLADNAGLRQAFRAYKYYTRDQPVDVVLPGLEFTSDQLFFIGNAYKWCANIEARTGELMSLKDAHATERLRCNAATMNIATFQETFSCPAGSTMAPDKRCVTW
ncbi:neprilysin-1-like isoform X1 [Varroa jacobsoni]|nr:neprilysin-1-like isoform X1 [Varroa jacobsoni]